MKGIMTGRAHLEPLELTRWRSAWIVFLEWRYCTPLATSLTYPSIFREVAAKSLKSSCLQVSAYWQKGCEVDMSWLSHERKMAKLVPPTVRGRHNDRDKGVYWGDPDWATLQIRAWAAASASALSKRFNWSYYSLPYLYPGLVSHHHKRRHEKSLQLPASASIVSVNDRLIEKGSSKHRRRSMLL